MISYQFHKFITAAALGLTMAVTSTATWAGQGEEQACAGEAAQKRDVRMSAVRVAGKARWANGSSVIRLKVDGESAACWLNRHGKVRKVVFGEGVGPAVEQACAGEASQIKDVPMRAIRTKWAFEGPKRQAWVRLDVDGHKGDCHVNKHGEVSEVQFWRDR